jgi:hypothetical protein
MRHALLSVLGAASLGLCMLTADAITAAPAKAQGFSITVGSPYGYDPYPVPPRRWGHWRRTHPRPVYYRPAYGGGYDSACRVRVNRYFDGYSWVTERRRTCW